MDSSSNSNDLIGAREQDGIGYDYTAMFIRIINKHVEVLLKLLQVKYSSDSPLDMIDVIIVLIFIPISLVYMVAAEVITHVPNTSYRHVIGPILYISGVLTWVLLLLTLFPTFWLFILLPYFAFLFTISMWVLYHSRQQIFEFFRDGIYARLHNSSQWVFNLFHSGEANPQAFSGNPTGNAPAAV
ncbi:uncharacterized protein LOC121238564 [Juglans microcarpa x Juglans regia]|uniref:uncharacterized protein LOC121238564 n=1 Tax=Juglans microcarpa x Juglans regia TaxID=2249226 RepID=UPI001B7DA11C|nr:uncharacterized protein LOC121238564 [Juglans microcarpa x Juglans regia]